MRDRTSLEPRYSQILLYQAELLCPYSCYSISHCPNFSNLSHDSHSLCSQTCNFSLLLALIKMICHLIWVDIRLKLALLMSRKIWATNHIIEKQPRHKHFLLTNQETKLELVSYTTPNVLAFWSILLSLLQSVGDTSAYGSKKATEFPTSHPQKPSSKVERKWTLAYFLLFIMESQFSDLPSSPVGQN